MRTWPASNPLSTCSSRVRLRGKKTGDDQQRRAQADFEADQAFAKAQAAASFGDGVASGAQRFLRIVAGESPRGKRAEHKPGEQREAESEHEDAGIHADFLEPGNIERCRGDQQLVRSSLQTESRERHRRRPAADFPSAPWRNWRPRLAPRAVRIAASRLRDAIRESRRLARLMQTISSTAPTAAASIHKPSRARPVTSSCTGMSVAFRSSFGRAARESRLDDVDLGERLLGGDAAASRG